MYPNFDNKQDRSAKHQDLLARIARDQRLDAMKREAYANAIWATDSEDSKLKDATETGDTLARLVAAMKAAASSSDKPNPSGFKSVGDLYDAMGDASSPSVFSQAERSMNDEDRDATAPVTDVPMLEEPMLEEPMLEEKRSAYDPEDSAGFRKDIADIFKRHPILSTRVFRPVIMRDGVDVGSNYRVRHSDGGISSEPGRKLEITNELLSEVDWSATINSILDKSGKQRVIISRASDILNKRARFRQLQNFARQSKDRREEPGLNLMASDDLDLKEMDAYQSFDMENASPDETLRYFNWLQSRGFTPSEVDDTPQGLLASDLSNNKRGLEDSAVSLDTRSAKKSPELTNLTERARVQYLFNNIDGLDSLKIQPYINKKGEVVRSEKAYLGPELKVFIVSSGIAYKNQKQANKQINWTRTLSHVIDVVGNYVRGYNQEMKKETDPGKRLEIQNEVEDLLDLLKIADPEQGKASEYLQGLPPSSYETPAVKTKQAPTISAKKDFTYEPPAGKGLVGRGLMGAGRPYNLNDIEGSGRASDLKYKRIGTKFIRKADLNSNRLKLVFPSRNSVGPIREMSDELTAMVKDLLYNDNISQQSYRALSVEDQRVFYEIIKKTHVDHSLQEPMVDPRITLKAEFDKLRGEIALGNDNKDMLRELYRLSTDMFEQKMISNREFKAIMSALI